MALRTVEQKVSDLLESLQLKGVNLTFCRRIQELVELNQTDDMNQDEEDRLHELWERYC
jgi:hypothetical protein